MRLNELLLNDFQTVTVFEMYAILFCTAFLGAMIFILLAGVFKWDLNEQYRKGQIDALNGKIKYEKQENEIKEIVWRHKA